MISTLDIIDSAIKIGLGALISGITAWLTAAAKNKHDRKIDLITYKRSKLNEIAEKSQKAAELSNGITLKISRNIRELNFKELSNDSHLLTNVKEICDMLSSAVAISYLIGDEKLSALMKDYWHNRNSLYRLLADKDFEDVSTVESYNNLKTEVDAIRDRIFEHYSHSLKTIHR